MAKANGSSLYGGRRKGVIPLLCLAVLLGLIVSIERAVFDVLGEMWGTLLLDSLAMLFGVTGLLGICAKDTAIILLYAMWSVLAIGLNILLILIYNNLGLLAQKEKYLGMPVRNNNYWKTHGIGCGQEPRNGSSNQEEEVLSNSSGMELVELEPDGCLVSYSIIETIHAAIYMLIAVVSLNLCIIFLLCPRRSHRVENHDDEEEFSYVSVAQHFGDSRPPKHSHWK